MKQKPYRTRYAGSRGKGVVVTLPFDPRRGICEACGKSKERGEIKMTALHHWWYAYQPKTVKKNPLLALENTSELCYYCHQLADAIRALLYAHTDRVVQVAKLLRGEQREKFKNTVTLMVRRLERTETDISPLAKVILEMSKNGKK